MKKHIRPLFLILSAIFVIFAISVTWFITPVINNFYIASIVSPATDVGPVVPVVQSATSNKFGLSLATRLYILSDTELNAELNDIATLGIGWIRVDAAWDILQLQGNNGPYYNWAPLDRVVKSANAHNIKVLPILTYTPTWARLPECKTSQKCMPADPATFAEFARLAVERYAPQGVHAWEIWNEPNIPGFWLPAPSASAYTTLLKTAYTAIKTADPSAIVITGGLSPAATIGSDISPTDFLSGLYKQGAGGYFDAVGFHPYSFPVKPSMFYSWNAWSQMSLTTTNLRGIMTANGDSAKQIWMTEFGAPTGGPGIIATVDNFQLNSSPDHVDENLQAEIIGDAIRLAQTYSWAGPLFIYSYKDVGTSPTTIENFFGILRFDGSPKPAYDIIKKLIAPTALPPVIPAPTSTQPPTSTTTTSIPSVPPPNPTPTPTTTIDTTPPSVNSFDVQPRTIIQGATVTSTFAVSDSGGSFLKKVYLNRALSSASSCNEANRSSCVWVTVQNIATPTGLNLWTSTLQDSPKAGSWLYGLAVFDGAGKIAYEPAVIKVTVNPSSSPSRHRIPERSRYR